MKETMSAPEAARALQVGLNYLYSLLLTGKLPGERVNGRWQIDAADVRARIAETEKYKRHE
jgi:excisionase family DNA binding protein